MSSEVNQLNPRPVAQSDQPADSFLVSGIVGGDAAALRKLMGRYDRLVRYAIYQMSKARCVQDADWLETLASDTWTGFVQSVQRNPQTELASVKAYLVRIARNRCASALRRLGPEAEHLVHTADLASVEIESKMEEPIELLSRVELLDALRGCLEDLDADSRPMAGELSAITERRWKRAAENLGVSESTLRSRWSKVLERLRRCVFAKTGNSLAPAASQRDTLEGAEASAPMVS